MTDLIKEAAYNFAQVTRLIALSEDALDKSPTCSGIIYKNFYNTVKAMVDYQCTKYEKEITNLWPEQKPIQDKF